MGASQYVRTLQTQSRGFAREEVTIQTHLQLMLNNMTWVDEDENGESEDKADDEIGNGAINPSVT